MLGKKVEVSEYKGHNKWKTRNEALDRKDEQGMIHDKWSMIGVEWSGWYVIPTGGGGDDASTIRKTTKSHQKPPNAMNQENRLS